MPAEARGGGAWLEQELQTVVLRIEFWSSVSDCTVKAEKSFQLFLKTFEVDIRSFNKCFFLVCDYDLKTPRSVWILLLSHEL